MYKSKDNTVAQFRFAGFQFNTETYHLIQGQNRYDIRPKTAQLLAYLLTHSDRTLSKKELFNAIWQSEHVQDHTLFQLISEIRKLSPETELIRTQPNVGYRWVAKTAQKNRFHLLPVAKWSAAALLVGVLSISATLSVIQPTPNNQFPQFALPATNAYTKAVIALQQGEPGEAEHWLKFSLSENPDSRESKLLLAETLFLQDKLIEAENYVQSILSDNNRSSYDSSAASSLLSRVHQEKGNTADALRYALEGAQDLENIEAACTVKIFDDRIQSLQAILKNKDQSSELSGSLLANKDNSALPDKESKTANKRAKPQGDDSEKQEYPCHLLKSSPKADEVSACFNSNEITRFAINSVFSRFSAIT